jgi:uncharacterized protein (TIGR02145 family)/uncharacterized repeat protein (TIGR02543 family)
LTAYIPLRTLGESNLLSLFDEPDVTLTGDEIVVNSAIKKDILNYPVQDFGICVEKANSGECEKGNGERVTFGSASAGEKRSFTATFSGLQTGTYNIRPYYSNGIGGTYYEKATVIEYEGTAAETYTLTVNREPVAGGSVTPEAQQTNITAGTQVNITATPASGYTFVNWTGGTFADATSASTSVTVNGNTTITANFQEQTVTPPSVGTFTDSRDGKIYRKVTIGTQTWMAENLNYDVPNNTTDVCYENSADSCAKYGRLYDWPTAMEACPVGWHLPSAGAKGRDLDEWQTLIHYVGDWGSAGEQLKSTIGWYVSGYDYDYCDITDEYGFSALPGGKYDMFGGEFSFNGASYHGQWWSADEADPNKAWSFYLYYRNNWVHNDISDWTEKFSVRCVQDGAW